MMVLEWPRPRLILQGAPEGLKAREVDKVRVFVGGSCLFVGFTGPMMGRSTRCK